MKSIKFVLTVCVICVSFFHKAANAASVAGTNDVFHAVSEKIRFVHLAMTEDGSSLVAVAELNRLLIFGVADGKQTATIECRSPHFAICRGKFLYVATGEGSVNVYSQFQAWKAVGQIKIDEKNVNYLSAANGSAFDGHIIASCGTERFAQKLWDCDVAHLAAHQVAVEENFEMATVANSGRNIMLQNNCNQTPGGIPSIYVYGDLLRGHAKPVSKGEYGSYGYLYQAGPSDCWFQSAGGTVFSGTPPANSKFRDSFQVPDQFRPLVYCLEAKRVIAMPLEGELAPVDSWNVQFEQTGQFWKPRAPIYHKLTVLATAATIGDKVVIFFNDKDEEILYRAELPISKAASETTKQSSAFTALPAKYRSDAMAITEDGSKIVLAHNHDNFISTWDVKTGGLLQQTRCASPRAILCRGPHIYVANEGKGTIGVYSDSLKLEDELAVGSPNPTFLMAAHGAHFDGKIFAHTGEGIFLVDSKRDKHLRIGTEGMRSLLTMIDFTGTHLLTFPLNSRAGPTSFALPAFLANARGKEIFQNLEIYPYLYQVSENGFWFGGRGIYFGEVPKPLARDLGAMVIPDRMAPLFYSLLPDRVVARKQNQAIQTVGERPLSRPAWLEKYEYRTDEELRKIINRPYVPQWTGIDCNSEGDLRGVYEPIAVTIGKSVYMYLLDPEGASVYRCELPAFDPAPALVATIGASTPSRTGDLIQVPTREPVTTFCVTETGDALIVAHEQANLLTVWNISNGTLIKSIPCRAPRFILCRGGSVYVANYGAGTVTVLNPSKAWVKTAEIPIGILEVFYLSASQGPNFKNEIIATCGKPGDRHVVLVDAQSKAVTHLVARKELGAVTSDWGGKVVIEQKDFRKDSMGSPRCFDYSAYVHGRPVSVGASEDRFGLLTQAHSGALWYDDSLSAIGTPPKAVLRPFPRVATNDQQHGLLFPDQNLGLYYSVEADRIVARSADILSLVVGYHSAVLPRWATTPVDRYIPSSTTVEGDADEFAPSMAVTIGNHLHLFALHAHLLWHYVGPSFAPEVAKANTGALTPSTQPSQPFQTFVASERPHITRSADKSSLLFLDDHALRILDAQGTGLIASMELPASYRKIFDRKDYFVALGATSVDLLDKKTGKILKQIDIDGSGTRDMVIKQNATICYVSAVDADLTELNGRVTAMPRVWEVNEKTGQIRVLRHVYGEFLALSPDGENIYTILRGFTGTDEMPGELGVISGFRRDLDWLLRFTLARETESAFVEAYDLDTNGTMGITTSDDHSLFATFGHSEYGHLLSRKFPNLTAAHADYFRDEVDTSMDFSPTDPLVACTTVKAVMFFDRDSGDPVKSAIAVESAGLRGPFDQCVFTPSGKSIVVIGIDTQSGRRVARILPLLPMAFLARPPAAPAIFKNLRSVVFQPSGYKPKAVPLIALQGLKPAPTGKLTVKQLAYQNADAIVLVGDRFARGAGFFIGTGGYVVTNSTSLGSDGKLSVWVRINGSKGVSIQNISDVELLRVDDQRGLALLKVGGATRRILHLAEKAGENGEPLVVVVHSPPGGAFQDFNISTGVISGIGRSIHGIPYTQISVPLAIGSMGSAVLNERGEVVGLAARKGPIEDTNFAIPLEVLRSFLNDCSLPPPAGAVRVPPPAVAATPPIAHGPILVVKKTVFTPLSGHEISVSPNGERFAWPRRSLDNKTSQMIIDGRPSKAYGEVRQVKFSADSRHWAYFAGSADQALPGFLVFDGREIPVLSRDRFVDFHLTPNGNHVFYTLVDHPNRGKQISVDDIGAINDERTTLVIDGIHGKAFDGELMQPPSFTPDGLHSVFTLAWRDSRHTVIQDGVGTVLPTTDRESLESVARGGHYAYLAVGDNNNRVVYDGVPKKSYPNMPLKILLSPDGHHLIYAAVVDNKAIVNIDGEEHEGEDPILSNGDEFHYAYFNGESLVMDGKVHPFGDHPPDSNKLILGRTGHFAYTSTHRDGTTYTYTLVVDDVVTPLDALPHHLEFSPDGNHFAYTIGDNRTQMCRCVIDGKPQPCAFTDIVDTAWSKDGKHFAATAKRKTPLTAEEHYLTLDGAELLLEYGAFPQMYFDEKGGFHAITFPEKPPGSTVAMRLDVDTH